MAAATAVSDFEDWLTSKLEKLNIDHEVFGSYIVGIMESEDSTEEDKTEALTDILSEISVPVEEVCQEIFQHWEETSQEKLEQQNHAKLLNKEDSDAKMASIMEKHATTQEVKRELTTEDKERKAALVAKYGDISESDEEIEEEDNSDVVNKTTKTDLDDLLTPNTNAAGVVKQQQEQREKNKQDHAKRRENEKTQREQQQQKSQDRKDKEKKRTQKQERKR